MKKLELMIKRLRQKSSELRWVETDTDGMFSVDVSLYTLALWGDTSAGVYSLSVITTGGQRVELINGFHPRLKDTYLNARRIAMKADEVIDDIIAHLEAMDEEAEIKQ